MALEVAYAVLKTAEAIDRVAKTVKGLQAQSQRLQQRVHLFTPLLEEVIRQERSVDTGTLERLQQVLDDALDLVEHFCEKEWWKKALDCKKTQGKFNNITERLCDVHTMLQTEIGVNILAKVNEFHSEDRCDLQADFYNLQDALTLMFKEHSQASSLLVRQMKSEILAAIKTSRVTATENLLGYQELRTEDIHCEPNPIATGGFGAVYLAAWGPDRTMVAAKRLFVLSEEGEEEFFREAKIHGGLRHPNVVHMYGACTVKPDLIMVMEHAPLGSLFDVLYQSERALPVPMSWPQKVKVLSGVCSGLNYLHSQSPVILHNDLC